MPQEPEAEKSPSVRVAAARLDTLWPHVGLPRVDLLKLDVEGAEEAALTGAAETIGRHRPFILCSYEHASNDRDRLTEIVKGIDRGYLSRDIPDLQLLTFEPL